MTAKEIICWHDSTKGQPDGKDSARLAGSWQVFIRRERHEFGSRSLCGRGHSRYKSSSGPSFTSRSLTLSALSRRKRSLRPVEKPGQGRLEIGPQVTNLPHM